MRAFFPASRATWLTGALASLALLGVLGAVPATGQNKADVQSVDAASAKKVLQSYQGKVVLVNYWATWCAPCVDEFPALVKLQKEYRDRGLVVVGISFDDPDERDKVLAFTHQNQVDFPILVRKGGSLEKFSGSLDKSWNGVLPTTYVIGKDGKRVGKPMTGARTYEQFAAAVEPLLK